MTFAAVFAFAAVFFLIGLAVFTFAAVFAFAAVFFLLGFGLRFLVLLLLCFFLSYKRRAGNQACNRSTDHKFRKILAIHKELLKKIE